MLKFQTKMPLQEFAPATNEIPGEIPRVFHTRIQQGIIRIAGANSCNGKPLSNRRGRIESAHDDRN